MKITVSWGVLLLPLAIGAALLFVGDLLKRGRRARKPEPPPPLLPLSKLSTLSFLTALAALLAALAAIACGWTARYHDVVSLGDGDVRDLRLAAQILAWVTLLPAVGTVALAIAARGTIREARDGLRGRSLYHSAVLVALLSGAGVWAYLA
jgi:hypothetical protein